MRLNLHDFSGHPFQVQLSRELAKRGHEVLHGFSTQYVTGHGRLHVGPGDPSTLRIEGVTGDRDLIKYSPVGRMRFEMGYARAWERELDRENFDLVIACNVPMFTLARVQRYFARREQPWMLWHQDLYSLGIASELDRRLPAPLARVMRAGVERVERTQVVAAHAVVAIADAMTDQYAIWNVDRDKVHVMPNWAPLDDITPSRRDNEWAYEVGLPSNGVRVMYAGTLGHKHNPMLLLDLINLDYSRGDQLIMVPVWAAPLRGDSAWRV